jgi:hypothetical protein
VASGSIQIASEMERFSSDLREPLLPGSSVSLLDFQDDANTSNKALWIRMRRDYPRLFQSLKEQRSTNGDDEDQRAEA